MADTLIISSSSSFLVYIAIFTISVFLIYNLLLRKPNHHGELKLPPGNTLWPIIGENLQFAIASYRGNPEKFINDRTSKHDDKVFRTCLFGENMAVFCGPAGNKFIFSNEGKYVRSWWPSSVKRLIVAVTRFVPDDTKHTRRTIHEYVKPEALHSYIPVIDSMAKQHLDREWPQKEVFKAFPLIKKFIYGVICRLFMNIEDPHQVAKLSRPFESFAAGIISVPVNFPGTGFNKAMKAAKSIQEELMCIIRQREKDIMNKDQVATPGRDQDMLTRMLLSEHEMNDCDKETHIANSLITLIVGSTHTTTSAISSTIRYLAEFPDVYNLVLKEQMEIARSKSPNEFLNWKDIQKMKYSWMVVSESMRLMPAATGTFREVIADFTFSGFTIPKGWKAFWTVTSTNKNPKYFPDPDRFDPSRFEGHGPAPFTYVPFGGGPHMCPGNEYAKVQILIFIHNLVIKFKWTKVIPDEKITYTNSAIPVNGFPLRIEPRV